MGRNNQRRNRKTHSNSYSNSNSNSIHQQQQFYPKKANKISSDHELEQKDNREEFNEEDEPKQSPATHQNTEWVMKNGPHHAAKEQLLENSQVGTSESEPISISELHLSNRDDAGCVFEKLRLGVEEPQLSEEQLRINDQLQQDELLAMESIYGDNVSVLENQGGLRSFQILVHIEAGGELTVTANLNSSGNLKMKSESDYSYSLKLQYLPPIVLSCLLPKSYPSHLSPYFTISVQWLDSIRISKLCSMLDVIWADQPGQEVIYQWVEWLQTSSLSCLGAEQEITLGPYGTLNSEDIRAISESVSPEVDIPSLRNYSDEQCHETFRQNLHECLICYGEYAGYDFIRLPCQHFFCCTCMKTYSDIHITEGTVNKLQCPNEKCGCMVPPGLLKRLLGDEEYERWESLMLQKTLDSMSDVANCPRCETPCIEDEDHYAQCSKCLFSFCTLCRDKRHVGEECLTPEIRLRVLEERQNSSQLGSKQRQKEQEMINNLLSLKEILRDSKQCPSCKIAISRIAGCNKMECQNCGQYFCYRCNKCITGYDHFREGACNLFPPEEIQLWEERMNDRRIEAQVQAFFLEHAHTRCPNCRQPNLKLGNNNHIKCQACQQHYCYVCKKIVRSMQHYGRKGCKQHTAD
ncbi:uncharacterized protein LOC126680224 [Mercurialis annua]|uniref:uncharacterized protein LOC126680224 n=1 Tax=Mercurialis annua TaxID=3986 RepID=UPI00215EFE77|nr:uncharacterized protein LOC126680224 [Mercurialis annua]XP_055961995.1 uncharacterized protein LOC126680224 [Mercurialis annua]XP_055961996.1 uncharacterized protein LOC126680224 [Mercurialis annua]